MELPLSPPTDNLYKFIALTGVVLVVLAFVLPSRQRYELLQQSEELTEQKAAWDARKGDHDAIAKIVQDQVAIVKATAPKPTTEAVARTAEEIWTTPQVQQMQELLAEEAKIEAKLHYLNLSKNLTDSYQRCFCGMSGVGVLLCYLGFQFWYVQVQKPEDELLQLVLNKARKEAE